MQNVTIALFHDTLHGKKKNAKWAVKIRITFLRKRRYYRTGVDLTKEEWNEIGKPGRKLSHEREILLAAEARAKEIIAEMPFFTFDAFKRRYFSKRVDNTIGSLLKQYEASLRKRGKISTANIYRATALSFTEWKDIPIEEVSPDIFYDYEKYMLGTGVTSTTIGMYLRNARNVINIAIENGLIKREQYPFGKRRYVIPKGERRNSRMVLLKDDIRKIENYKADTWERQRAIDYFLFSYYAFGINMKDILHLRHRNIHEGIIRIERSKTQKPLIIPVTDKMQKIIDTWGGGDKEPDSLIFPILKGVRDPEEKEKRKNYFISNIDRLLNKVGKQLELKVKLSTYVARHSFATASIRSGFDKYQTGELMGHSTKETTDNYFAGYDQHFLKKVQSKL